MHGLLRGPEREDHHGSGGKQDQEVCGDILVESLHEHSGIARVSGDGEGIEPGDGNADEVHEVVTGECEGQGEGSREDGDAQDVDLEALDEEERQRADHPADEDCQQEVVVDPTDEVMPGEDGFQPLEYGEVDDRREGCSAPERAVTAEYDRVSEREDDPGDVHDDGAAGEGNDHREEDCRDDTHGSRRVDVLSERSDTLCGVVGYLVDRDGDGRSEQAEDERDGRRRGEPPGVVEVEEDDVGEHDAQIEHHHLVEGEEPGVEHAAACDLHHAARRHDADDDAERGDQEDDFHRGGLGADGGVQEVDGIVRNADEESRDGENSENADNEGVNFTHAGFQCNL